MEVLFLSVFFFFNFFPNQVRFMLYMFPIQNNVKLCAVRIRPLYTLLFDRKVPRETVSRGERMYTL